MFFAAYRDQVEWNLACAFDTKKMQQSMQKDFSSIGSFSIILLISTLGFVFGCVAGIITAGISYTSVFASWKFLDGPMKFSQILEVTSHSIWAQSENGKTYSWNFNCYLESKCNQWIEAQTIPTDLHDFGQQPMKKSDSCQTIAQKHISNVPGDEIECALGQYSGPEYGESVYYALADDGTIWALQTHSSLIEAYVLPVYFSVAGLVIGLVASVIFLIWRRKVNRLPMRSN